MYFYITVKAWWRLKSPASRLFSQSFIHAQIKENIKAPRHWPLCGEFTGDRWIPRTNGQLRGKCFHLMTSSWYILKRGVGAKWAKLRGCGLKFVDFSAKEISDCDKQLPVRCFGSAWCLADVTTAILHRHPPNINAIFNRKSICWKFWKAGK